MKAIGKSIPFFVVAVALSLNTYSQLTLTSSTQENTHCGGVDCNYSGPSILINEIMMSPTSFDGSLWEPNCNANARCGEWIELYNPDLCEPVDISCYYLGNNAADAFGDYGGGVAIPNGTIVPPRGFVIIRGSNAPAVPSALLVQNGGNTLEIIVNNSNMACIDGGDRLWFPNSGGWFAFYDATGQVQDAVSWASAANTNLLPCIPTSACGSASTLSNYDNIPANLKNYISNQNASNHLGQTLRRIPDGGPWQVSTPSTPTYGNCNSTCVLPAVVTCNGTATVIASGGSGPYSYLWNDSQSQTTATAIELCAGNYCVTVTDNLGSTETICVDVFDHVPTVTFAALNDLCIDAGITPITGGNPTPGTNETGVYTGTGVALNNFNPATAGAGTFNITYTFTDTGGCVNSAMQPITVNPLPTVSLSGLAATYCLGASPVNLTTQPAGGTLFGNGLSGNSFSPTAAGVGTHTLTYEYTDANGCDNTSTLNVEILSEPTLTIIAPTTICIYDNPIALQGTPSGGTFTGNGISTNNFDPQSAGAGVQTITYSYQDANGCQGETDTTIDVIPRPTLSLNLNPYYCIESGLVTLSPTPAGGVLTGTGLNGNSINISALNVGPYTVSYEYTDNNGCENQLTQGYQVIEAATPSFESTALCFQTIQFTNTSSQLPDSISSEWNFASLGTSSENSPIFEFSQPGTVNVTLTITDGFGCVSEITQPVTIEPSVLLSQIQIANIITPNGDAVNDVFGLPTEFDECLKYTLRIYNRWGNYVFEMTEFSEKFKGISNTGSTLSDGVYYYVLDSEQIDCSDPAFENICKGTLTISK